MNKREVSFSNFITLIKNSGPFSIIGIVFDFVAVFILLPMILLMSNTFSEPYEKYDFDAIEKNGTMKTATITDVQSVDNVSVNNRHPLKIIYEFSDKDSMKTDAFQTMDFYKAQDFKVGLKIQIKTFENESKIQNLKPFAFPFFVFYILPFIFFTIGSIFLIIGLIPVLKDYDLYKNGIVKEGFIISMIPNSGLPITNIGQSILINYYYVGSNGQKIFGKSKTKDFSIMIENKPGDSIKLFASEKDETKSCMVPKLEAMKNNWRV